MNTTCTAYVVMLCLWITVYTVLGCELFQKKVLLFSCDFMWQKWLEAADLRVELLQYLKEQVLQNFRLNPELNLEEEDVFMKVDLLHPLECFLFGKDPQEGLEKLKQGCSSSQLCGRVFKEGETVYSCRSEHSRFSARHL